MKRLILGITLLCTALAGCKKTSPMEGNSTITFRLEYDSLTTRTGSEAKIDEIEDLNIFLYDTKGKLSFYKYIDNIEEVVEMEIYTDKEYSVYALANTGEISDLSSIVDEELINKLNHKFEKKEFDSGGLKKIPMSGHLPLKRISKGETLTIPLTRLVSKFRVIIDNSSLSEDVSLFEIKEVAIKNVNSCVGYFRNSRGETLENIIPSGEVKKGELLSSVTSTGVDFLIPENMQGDLLPSNVDETTHVPPGELADLATYLQITVGYKSKKHYDNDLIYRYYLHNGRRLDNFDIERNYMYLCRTSFTGEGLEENSWRIDKSSLKKYVTAISISPQEHKFTAIGDNLLLTPTIEPADAYNNSLEWESTDPSVATVSDNGTVTSTGDGECIIKATAKDGSGVSCEVKIIVDSYIFPTSVEIIPSTLELFEGQSAALEAKVLPENANNKRVIWSSGNKDIATISSDGTIFAISAGSCTISATTVDKGLVAYGEIEVREMDFSIDEIPDILYPNYNTPFSISHTANPAGTPIYSLEKISGDEALQLNGNYLTAHNPVGRKSGEIARYKVKGELNSITKEIETTVSVGEISLTPPLQLYVGIKEQIALSSCSPSDADITWSSSDVDKATISSDGTIHPLSEGNIKIRATLQTTGYDEVDCNILSPTIYSDNYITIYQGVEQKINYSTTPIQAHDMFSWSVVGGDEYISISEDGTICGEKPTEWYDVLIRGQYIHSPSIYKEIWVRVLPALTISSSGKSLANINFTLDRDIPGIPTTLTLNIENHLGSGVEWMFYDANHQNINQSNQFHISPSGVLTALNSTSGRYYIKAKSGEYYSNEIEIDVYLYLEYQVGIEPGKMPHIDVNPIEGKLKISYSLFSQWHPYSWSRIEDGGLEDLLTKLDKYKCINGENDGSRHYISKNYNEVNQISSLININTTYNPDLTPNPEYDIFTYIPAQSYLISPTTGDIYDGLHGMFIHINETGKNALLYIRQSSVLFNISGGGV